MSFWLAWLSLCHLLENLTTTTMTIPAWQRCTPIKEELTSGILPCGIPMTGARFLVSSNTALVAQTPTNSKLSLDSSTPWRFCVKLLPIYSWYKHEFDRLRKIFKSMTVLEFSSGNGAARKPKGTITYRQLEWQAWLCHHDTFWQVPRRASPWYVGTGQYYSAGNYSSKPLRYQHLL